MAAKKTLYTEQDFKRFEDEILAHHVVLHSILVVLAQANNELYLALIKQLTAETNYLEKHFPELSGSLPELDKFIKELVALKQDGQLSS